MADIVSPEVRSRMMSGIRGKNTAPEMIVRSGMYRRKLRFRLHVKGLPGKPDLVFPKWKAVLFVHGCFWHQHDCPVFKMPSSRTDFWRTKLARNRFVDERNRQALLAEGWRCGVIWECALRKNRDWEKALDKCAHWVRSGRKTMEIGA